LLNKFGILSTFLTSGKLDILPAKVKIGTPFTTFEENICTNVCLCASLAFELKRALIEKSHRLQTPHYVFFKFYTSSLVF